MFNAVATLRSLLITLLEKPQMLAVKFQGSNCFNRKEDTNNIMQSLVTIYEHMNLRVNILIVIDVASPETAQWSHEMSKREMFKYSHHC